MKTKSTALVIASFAIHAFTGSLAQAAEPAKAQPNADTILRQMSSKLASAQRFSFKARRHIDAALLEGRDLPGDAHVSMIVQRPNKIAAESVSKGDVRHFYADGKNLTLVDVNKNLYSTVPMHTSIDGLVVELAQKFGFTPPLAEFAVSNVYEDIHWKVQSVSYVGEARVGGSLGLGGVACHIVALSGKAMDAQLWVGADNLPRLLVATVKGHPHKPQIKVEMSDWNLAAKTADRDFTYVPSKGAEKISMATTAEITAAQKKH